jgi:hypothetical protein
VTVVLSVAVQHHPDRADLAAQLLRDLDGLAELVVDPDPRHRLGSPWRTYRRCLESTPEAATHRLILQDDALPCRNLVHHAARVAAAWPDRLVTLYVGGNMRLGAPRIVQAAQAGRSWAELPRYTWIPAVALLWPVPMIARFLHWIDDRNYPDAFRADDERIGRWLRKTGHVPVATVPSLVDHPDDVPSLIGTRNRGGRDPSRVSVCWIGDCDPIGVDWR